MWGVDLCNNHDSSKRLAEWLILAEDVGFNFAQRIRCTTECIVHVIILKDGYIGWHDNRDAPGYTILFNWSEGGDAFYRYRDWKTGKVHTIT